MLVNYRTFTTLLSGMIFEWLVKTGVVELSQNQITADKIEGVIMTLILLIAAFFRFYAGKKLFTRKPK